MAINYFTKWIKIVSYVILNYNKVAYIIYTNLICHYDILHEITTDNCSHFRNEMAWLFNEDKIVQ